MSTSGRPRDPRGRPHKKFTTVAEMSDGLKLVRVRAHDADHARDLAARQIKRAQHGTAWHVIKLVLRGHPREAT